MTKSELIQRLAEMYPDPRLYHRDFERVVNKVFEEISNALARGGRGKYCATTSLPPFASRPNFSQPPAYCRAVVPPSMVRMVPLAHKDLKVSKGSPDLQALKGNRGNRASKEKQVRPMLSIRIG